MSGAAVPPPPMLPYHVSLDIPIASSATRGTVSANKPPSSLKTAAPEPPPAAAAAPADHLDLLNTTHWAAYGKVSYKVDSLEQQLGVADAAVAPLKPYHEQLVSLHEKMVCTVTNPSTAADEKGMDELYQRRQEVLRAFREDGVASVRVPRNLSIFEAVENAARAEEELKQKIEAARAERKRLYGKSESDLVTMAAEMAKKQKK